MLEIKKVKVFIYSTFRYLKNMKANIKEWTANTLKSEQKVSLMEKILKLVFHDVISNKFAMEGGWKFGIWKLKSRGIILFM